MDDPKNTQISRRGFLQWSAAAAGGAALSGACHVHEKTQEITSGVTLDLWRVRPGGAIPVRGEVPSAAALVEVDAQGQALRALPGRVRGAGEGRAVIAPGDDQGRELFRVALAWRDEEGRVRVSNAVEVVCTPLMVGG
jgi:hypothetical protein